MKGDIENDMNNMDISMYFSEKIKTRFKQIEILSHSYDKTDDVCSVEIRLSEPMVNIGLMINTIQRQTRVGRVSFFAKRPESQDFVIELQGGCHILFEEHKGNFSILYYVCAILGMICLFIIVYIFCDIFVDVIKTINSS